MQGRKITTALAAAAISAGLLVSVPTVSVADSAAVAEAAAEAPRLIAGQMVDGQGRAMGGVELVVNVQHHTEDGTELTPIARGVAASDGSFSLRGALGGAPASLNPDGSVSSRCWRPAPTAAGSF